MENETKAIGAIVLEKVCSFSCAFGNHAVNVIGKTWLWAVGSAMVYLYWKKTRRNAERNRFNKIFDGFRLYETAMLMRCKDLPKWVCFPDVQRAEWLNQILTQMWPFISDMVAQIIRENVEPEVKKAMPGYLKSFHFEEFNLGDLPVRIGGVRVYTEHVKRNEILVDAEVIYAGDAVCQVAFKTGMKFGLKDIQLRGTVRIELRPILPKPPLIGALTFYFLDKPEIDFDLTNMLNILDITGLDSVIKNVVDDVIERVMVLPARIVVPIAQTEDLQSLQFPEPLGVLRANIIEAKGIKAADRKAFSKDSSDPYVVSKVGSFKHETVAIDNTLSPKWKNESFDVFIDRVVGTNISFEVMDKDKNGEPDFLGRAAKNLEELFHGGDKTTDFVLPLEDGKGTLTTQLEWFNLSDDVAKIKKQLAHPDKIPLGLFVKLEHATGLPAIKMEDGTCSPHVEITLGKKTVESKTKRNTRKPIWNELHCFFVNDCKEQEIHFKIKDEDNDKKLGTLKFNLSRLLETEDMKISDEFRLKDCFTDGKIQLALELKALVSKLCEEEEEKDHGHEHGVTS